MSRYDKITEINKNVDHIEHVEKFNPYHDKLGRFSSANGFASFSANPNTKAGQMAIDRESKNNPLIGLAYGVGVSKPKQNLVDGLGKEHAENIEALVSKAPDCIKQAWEKYGNEIKVAENNHAGIGKCEPDGKIFVNIKNDAQKSDKKEPYESTRHESGHSIDRAISREVGYRYSQKYKDGLFEKTLVKEADAYVKERQKQLSKMQGYKVGIDDARLSVSLELRVEGVKKTGDVSDIFEGATKGKVTGSAGHGKQYWTGYSRYGYKVPGRSVAVEAFAEMFSATTTNKDSLENIKKYFPESYGVFTEMLGGL